MNARPAPRPHAAPEFVSDALSTAGDEYPCSILKGRPIMKIPMLVLLLAVLVACGGGVPEGRDSVQTDAPMEPAEVDDLEGEEEGQVLEVPPEGSLPLSQVLAKLEIAGHTFITEVEFEDGVWEIEYVVGGEEYEILVDPMTGEALADETEETEDD
jgi:hypothetical protein